MDYKKLAKILFPDSNISVEDWIKKYPKRNLKESAEVTRIAPSPTGYLHIGTAYQALLDKTLALKSGGVFFMRLEDTDGKREIEGAGEVAYKMLSYFNLMPDEGYTGGKQEKGQYGPYMQSHRAEIYKSFAKRLIENGRAFPCFCDKSEGKADVQTRREQMLEDENEIDNKDACRNLTLEEIEQNIKNGKKFAIRLLSTGDSEKSFEFVDLIKGKRQIRQNDKDIVLLKSDGIPPYAFAHAVDDTLMGVTTVVRGEEWYPSLAAHLEVFDALNLPRVKYAHTPVICKNDNDGNKRKLSKRKDPEADARYFIKEGYPVVSVLEYLLNLLNSDFEDWRAKNPNLSYNDFPFSINKIGSNNPMFDFAKLNDVSKNVISRFTPEEIYFETCIWAKEYSKTFYEVIKDKKSYCLGLFSIDRVNSAKPRKDIAKWSDVEDLYFYVFEKTYNPKSIFDYEFDDKLKKEDITQILKEYSKTYDASDIKQIWFDKIKEICAPLGFCADMKAYKIQPEKYKGSIADVSNAIRVAITTKKSTPDMYEICKLLGEQTIKNRLQNVINLLK